MYNVFNVLVKNLAETCFYQDALNQFKPLMAQTCLPWGKLASLPYIPFYSVKLATITTVVLLLL